MPLTSEFKSEVSDTNARPVNASIAAFVESLVVWLQKVYVQGTPKGNEIVEQDSEVHVVSDPLVLMHSSTGPEVAGASNVVNATLSVDSDRAIPKTTQKVVILPDTLTKWSEQIFN
ncbi:hypothetical protein TSUD_217040 [Trifolium subterraneum]|uniref:Uncharacterized protein n=1 Tax=Trifolium subterraneum TaxID=3900 RepID=A0A2Z6NB58_TRISU|nr:hypothetical protein TSUD_217040 [Trifolium subterraneum]